MSSRSDGLVLRSNLKPSAMWWWNRWRVMTTVSRSTESGRWGPMAPSRRLRIGLQVRYIVQLRERDEGAPRLDSGNTPPQDAVLTRPNDEDLDLDWIGALGRYVDMHISQWAGTRTTTCSYSRWSASCRRSRSTARRAIRLSGAPSRR